jgi:hypothetical protein
MFLDKKVFKSIRTNEYISAYINQEMQNKINEIIDELIVAIRKPDIFLENKDLRDSFNKNSKKSLIRVKVDLTLIDNDGKKYLINFINSNANFNTILIHKKRLIKTVAISVSNNNSIILMPLIAISYNPNYPKGNSNWKMSGLFDLKNQLINSVQLLDL